MHITCKAFHPNQKMNVTIADRNFFTAPIIMKNSQQLWTSALPDFIGMGQSM
jgi:hypothetical protein